MLSGGKAQSLGGGLKAGPQRMADRTAGKDRAAGKAGNAEAGGPRKGRTAGKKG